MENSDRKYWTLEAMRKYGGSFVQILGELAGRADPVNLDRIKRTWPEYWKDYEARGRELEAGKDPGHKVETVPEKKPGKKTGKGKK